MNTRLLVTTLAALLFTAQAEAQRQRSEALEIARSTVLRGAVRDVLSARHQSLVIALEDDDYGILNPTNPAYSGPRSS